MKLYVESILPAEPLAVLEVFDSQPFRDRMNASAPVTTEVLETRMEGAIEVRRLRSTGKNDLPSVVAKVVGGKRLIYEQINRVDRERLRVDWEVKVAATDRFRCRGSTVMTPHPDGTRRVLDGVLEVDIPLVGRQIEKAIGPEFEKSLARAAVIAKELLEEEQG